MLVLPRLRQDQWDIAAHSAKQKIVAAGRRWGKTLLGGAVGISLANAGGRVAWCAPTYKNSRPMWRWVENVCAPLKDAGIEISKAERVITFPSGGFIGVYSMDNADSIRGEAFHLVIVDEAARIAEDVYHDAIEPTLADFDGTAILISTPHGRNWFFKEFQRALDDGNAQAAWRAASSANPNPNIQKAFRAAKDRVPERTYQQEWLAAFIEGGLVFRNIRANATAQRSTPDEHENHHIVIGVDWAQQHDFTVLTCFCATCRREVDKDRFNQVSWNLQRARLSAMAERWRPARIMAESNSIGSPNIEELMKEDLPIAAFETTATSKPPLIQSLILAFEKNEITILNDAQTINELEAFEEKRSATTGRPQFSAPQGLHDDCVISLALAWRAAEYHPLLMFGYNA